MSNDRQHQINVVNVWTQLERAADTLSGARSSTLWPARRGLLSSEPEHEINQKLDRVMRDLMDLRNYIWEQR